MIGERSDDYRVPRVDPATAIQLATLEHQLRRPYGFGRLRFDAAMEELWRLFAVRPGRRIKA
jgi:hypothetical protein